MLRVTSMSILWKLVNTEKQGWITTVTTYDSALLLILQQLSHKSHCQCIALSQTISRQFFHTIHNNFICVLSALLCFIVHRPCDFVVLIHFLWGDANSTIPLPKMYGSNGLAAWLVWLPEQSQRFGGFQIRTCLFEKSAFLNTNPINFLHRKFFFV